MNRPKWRDTCEAMRASKAEEEAARTFLEQSAERYRSAMAAAWCEMEEFLWSEDPPPLVR